MPELARTILQLLAVPMLLEEFAHRHSILHHGMEEVTLLIRLSAVTLHPEGANLLFPQVVIGLIVNGI